LAIGAVTRPETAPESARPTPVSIHWITERAAVAEGWPETTGERRGMSRTGTAPGKTRAAWSGAVMRWTAEAPAADAEARDW